MSEPTELAEKLKTEGERMTAFFAEMTDEQWSHDVYTEGTTWSIRSVLSHFVTSERGLIKLFERIRTTGEGAAEDFSIDNYNAAQQQKTENLTPAKLKEQNKKDRAKSMK